jgi:predicted double-glycine peptidase
LRARYASEGLTCEYRQFDSVAQLGRSDITLAVIRNAFLLDHCVAVLGVTDEAVTVADPATGIRSMSCEQFESIWRSTGVVLGRNVRLHKRRTMKRDL